MIVVIPAYEPDERLIQLLKEIKLHKDYNIIVVNDGSGVDKSHIFEEAQKYATVLEHLKNSGKGQAIKTALTHIQYKYTENPGIIIADADGQHKTEDIMRVSQSLDDNSDSLIIGIREFTGNVPLRSKFGNTVTKYVFQAASGVMISDTQTGLRAFHAQMIPFLLNIPGSRYEFEMNMLLECARQKKNIVQVPIETVYMEENKSSHFRTVRDSVIIYKDIIKFSCSSLVSFILDFFIYSIMIWITNGLLLSTSILISNVTARVLSSTFNFYVNRKFVFKNNDSILKTAAQYYALAAFILYANTGMLTLLTKYIIPDKYISKVITEITLFIISLAVQRVVIFKRTNVKGVEDGRV